ncbi:MAG: YggU family protein [Oceanospirillaceae bacterium]|nr:YggU family protein [Oceanospirillaceae bacterium]
MNTPEHSAAHYQWADGDLLLVCHLQPKASKSEFSGLHGDALKVRIQAPPVEGKANSELVKFLAKQFGVSKSAVSIISGELNRHKRVRITQPQRLPAEALITQS